MENNIQPEVDRSGKKKTLLIFIALMVALSGGYVGYKAYKKSYEQVQGKKGRGRGGAVAVDAVEPKIMPMRDLRNFTGSLKPWSSYDLAPKVGGRLEKLTVNIGDLVKKGDLIARIDDVEYRQSLAQAKAETEIAHANLMEAQVNLDLKKKEYARQKRLVSSNAVAKSKFETAESALQGQKALYRMKQAELMYKQTAQKTAELKVGYTTLYADWNDDRNRYVGERYVDPGTLLAANQPVVSIVDISRMKATIFVIERDYPFLKVGQTATVLTDAYPGKQFKGIIFKISQLLQENSRQAEVQLEILNKDLKLKPGMFVRVQIEFGRNDKARTVPRSSLVFRGGKQGLFRLSPELGKAFFTPVKTGIYAGDRVEIIEPKLNYPIVILGNHALANGMSVLPPEKYRKKLKKESAQGSVPKKAGGKN